MIPAGSSSSLIARSTRSPPGPISVPSQGAWSAPTPWWWVMVAPLATITSLAATLTRCHWPIGSSASWRAKSVKYSDAPPG